MIKLLKSSLLLFVLSTSLLSANTINKELKPEPYQKETSRWLVRLLDQLHYKPMKLDDAFSIKILENYLETLDPNKVYFYANDIIEFKKYETQLDDYIKSGDVELAFKIFTLYIKRIQERTKYSLQLLEKPFDFKLDEQYIWDREELDFLKNESEMNELWRKRVKNDFLNLKLAGKETSKINKILSKRYKLRAKRIRESNNEEVFQFFMNSYTSLIEPHTSYLAPRASEEFKIDMRLSLQGIGATLGSKDDIITIMKVMNGGPAEKQGELKKGDKILAVGQGDSGSLTDIIGWRVGDTVQKIRGDVGTVVRLSVLSKDEAQDAKPHIVSIVRDIVKLESQAAQYQILNVHSKDIDLKVGVVNLPTFYIDFAAKERGDKDYKSTTTDVRKILTKFNKENVQAMVMDLRNNGGGALLEARDLTGLFIDEGPVVQIKNSRDSISVDSDADSSVAWTKPMVVLTNRASASASEIFAAALQDYGRAVVVGERSFGKGTVQSVISLDNFTTNNEHSMGQLKLTSSQFFRINGGSTQNRGVIPDIQFPKHAWSDSYGESEYENALPWTSIKRSIYNMQGDLTVDIPQLRKNYKARELVNPEFLFIKDDYAHYKQFKDDVSISLSEKVRKAETTKREDRKIARKQKRQSITAGNLDPLITKVDILFNSKDSPETDVDDTDDGESITNKENNSEPAGDFVLMEAARIVSDLYTINQRKLIAKHNTKTPE